MATRSDFLSFLAEPAPRDWAQAPPAVCRWRDRYVGSAAVLLWVGGVPAAGLWLGSVGFIADSADYSLSSIVFGGLGMALVAAVFFSPLWFLYRVVRKRNHGQTQVLLRAVLGEAEVVARTTRRVKSGVAAVIWLDLKDGGARPYTNYLAPLDQQPDLGALVKVALDPRSATLFLMPSENLFFLTAQRHARLP